MPPLRLHTLPAYLGGARESAEYGIACHERHLAEGKLEPARQHRAIASHLWTLACLDVVQDRGDEAVRSQFQACARQPPRRWTHQAADAADRPSLTRE